MLSKQRRILEDQEGKVTGEGKRGWQKRTQEPRRKREGEGGRGEASLPCSRAAADMLCVSLSEPPASRMLSRACLCDQQLLYRTGGECGLMWQCSITHTHSFLHVKPLFPFFLLNKEKEEAGVGYSSVMGSASGSLWACGSNLQYHRRERSGGLGGQWTA